MFGRPWTKKGKLEKVFRDIVDNLKLVSAKDEIFFSESSNADKITVTSRHFPCLMKVELPKKKSIKCSIGFEHPDALKEILIKRVAVRYPGVIRYISYYDIGHDLESANTVLIANDLYLKFKFLLKFFHDTSERRREILKEIKEKSDSLANSFEKEVAGYNFNISPDFFEKK